MCTALAWFGHLDLLGCMPSFSFEFHITVLLATSRLSEFLSNISSHFPYYGALMCAVIPVNPLKFNLYNLSKKINKKWIEMWDPR